MGAPALPKAYSVSVGNKNLCARIGVRVDGVDQGRTIGAYDVEDGWARKLDGTILNGTIEPYWRDVSKPAMSHEDQAKDRPKEGQAASA